MSKKLMWAVTLVLLSLGIVFFISSNTQKEFSGYITSFSQMEEILILTIDQVEFLSGEEAVEAVMEDFECSRGQVYECAPSMNNNFYIRNLDTRTQEYRLNPKSHIEIFKNPGSSELEVVDVNIFHERLNEPESLLLISPIDITLKNDSIVVLKQRYTP